MIRSSLLICVLLIATRVLAQFPQHFAGFDEDKVTGTEDTECLRTVRTDGNKTWTNFYEFRTVPVPRVRFRQFEGNVSFEHLKEIDGGEDGEGEETNPGFGGGQPSSPELLQDAESEEEEGEETPINFRMEYEKLIEFLDNDGVPGYDEDSNDTIIQMKNLYNSNDRANFQSPWDRIERDFGDFDGSTVYTVKSGFEGFEFDMFTGDKEYRVNNTFGKPSNITFSPDEVHMSLKMPLDLFDNPLRNDTKIALCAQIIRKKGKATFKPGGSCSRGPKGKSPRNPKCMKPCPPETSAPETTATTTEATTVTTTAPETTTVTTTAPETTTETIGETPAPQNPTLLTTGDKDKEKEECYEGGEGEHEGEEPFDKEWNFNFTETEVSKQRKGGGRAHKDIEFQPDEDSPNVYVSWDPKIACIRKDKTVEEVDVVATLVDKEDTENPFEGRTGGNPGGNWADFLDPAHEDDEIVTTAYFTFDRELLEEVDSFYWDPEIGVDFEAADDGLEGEDSGEGEDEGENSGEGEDNGAEGPDGGVSAAANAQPIFGAFVAAASLAVTSMM